MKVIIHYTDNENADLHKILKITLPKSWKSGPTSKLLGQFVESYNAAEKCGGRNHLVDDEMHLEVKKDGEMISLASNAVIVDCIADRADVYVVHGAPQSLEEIASEIAEAKAKKEQELRNTVQCTRFGCSNRFPRDGPFPDCQHHLSPPVFHETAKFWSCCPHKKAYDWDDFQAIPGCQTGKKCTAEKENEGKLFLGGTDLRKQDNDNENLKSIDDFNKSKGVSVLDKLRAVFIELGLEEELFDQVLSGIRSEESKSNVGVSEADLLNLVAGNLGKKLKTAMKDIAVEQLRIRSPI